MPSVPVPPLIPGSANLSTLEVGTAKITSIVGDALSTLNTWKGSVTAASTANLTLTAEQTVDGVALVVGDTILVKDQTDGIENGLYEVKTTAWVRAPNLILGSNAAGIAIFVNEGTVNADTIWVCTNDAATAIVGTDALVIVSTSTIVPAKGTATIADFAAVAATVEAMAGTITVTTPTLAIATRSAVLVVTNANVTTTSVIGVTCVNPVANTGEPYAVVTAVAAGSFSLVVYSPIVAVTAVAPLLINFTVQ